MTRRQKSAGHDANQHGTTEGHGGKLANDTNAVGNQEATQVNEGKRTAESRHDRQTQVGTTNQTRSRRAMGGGGGVGGWH
jgi:hypothetical protein